MAKSWSDDFARDSRLDSSRFPVKWGDASEFSFSPAGLTLTSDGHAAGFMQQDQGRTEGTGYGTYWATFSMGVNQTPGGYLCLWPADNHWPGAEIDLAEEWSGQAFSTIHWKTAAGGDDYKQVFFSADPSKPITMAVSWSGGGLALFVNNAEIAAFPMGGSVPIPKDAAHGGGNEVFGVGNGTAAGSSVTVQSMAYVPSTVPNSFLTAPIVPSTHISVSSPGMQFISDAAGGATASISLVDAGLKQLYACVMTAQNVAESGWIPIALNGASQMSHDFHFNQSGDYVLAVSSLVNPLDSGSSSQIVISPHG